MPIIDSQVHAYDANTPKRPWHNVPNWPDHVTGDEMVAAMDKVGVDGAIFISAFSMYRYDASYAVEVQRAHPGRFALVKPVDPDDPAVADVIADWKKTPGTVGIRIMMTKESGRKPDDPGLGLDVVFHPVVVALRAVELTAASLCRSAAEQSELHETLLVADPSPPIIPASPAIQSTAERDASKKSIVRYDGQTARDLPTEREPTCPTIF